MKKLLVLFIALIIPCLVTAVCCPDGCFPDYNICCPDPSQGGLIVGFMGCHDGYDQYHCDGIDVFPSGADPSSSGGMDACLVCKCDDIDTCYWEENTYCTTQYGLNYQCNYDDIFLPSSTQCSKLCLDGCPIGTACCTDGYCSPYCEQCRDEDDNDFDTFIDWPADLGCDSYLDDDETNIGGKGTITGTVKDNNNLLIEDARVLAGGKETATNADGTYVLIGIDAGLTTVTASKTGYTDGQAEVTVTADETVTADIILNAVVGTGSIAGTVMDNSNNVIPGADVSIPLYPSATTDAQGEYTIINIAPNTYTVTASRGGYTDGSADALVVVGLTTTVNLVLNPIAGTGSIAGTVIDTAGNSLDAVSIQSDTGESTLTNNGVYSLTGIAPGSIILTASKVGYESGQATVDVFADQTSTADIVLAPVSEECNGDCTDGIFDSCICPECDGLQDSCDPGLICIDRKCDTTGVCSECSKCENVPGGCDLTECTLCTGTCYYYGFDFWFDDCRECEATTRCENYEQTKATCDADAQMCNLGNCFWNGANCITVDSTRIIPKSAKIEVGKFVAFTNTHYIGEEVIDVTDDSIFISSDILIAETNDNIAEGISEGIINIGGVYNLVPQEYPAVLTVISEGSVAELSHIIVKPLDATLNKGERLDYEVTAFYSDGNHADVTVDTDFTSSDDPIAEIVLNPATNEYTSVSAVDVGTVEITAEYEEGSITVDTKVTLTVIESGTVLSHIVLEPAYVSLNPTITQDYVTTAHYSDKSSLDVTLSPSTSYVSTNLFIATIDGIPKNRATAQNLVGLTTIVASYNPGLITKTDTAQLRVTNDKEPDKLNIHVDTGAGYDLVVTDLNLIEIAPTNVRKIKVEIVYTDTSSMEYPGSKSVLDGLVINRNNLDQSIADITFDIGAQEVTGIKLGTTNVELEYTEWVNGNPFTVKKSINLNVGEPDDHEDFCELVVYANPSKYCIANQGEGCWSSTVESSYVYTDDKIECCSDDSPEIWKYLSTSYDDIYHHSRTCYEQKWYETPTITYYSLYGTK